MLKRIIFNRVERWIGELEPEYRTTGYIRSSLGLLRVIGLPTNFDSLLASKFKSLRGKLRREAGYVKQHQDKYDVHAARNQELNDLGTLL